MTVVGRSSEHWATRIGVILAVAGSAVGLGNFLRFPGLAAKYGGGAFMIPYFISLLIIGIPICWCEWTLGRYGGQKGFNGAPGILRSLTGSKHFQYIGIISVLIPLVIYMYYVYIESWCLAYAWFYLSNTIPAPETDTVKQYVQFFSDYSGMEGNGLALTTLQSKALFFLVVAFVINYTLIYRGLNRGIETFCKLAMPTLVIAAFFVLIRVLTLGTPDPSRPDLNVSNGLGFMWNLKIPEGKTIWSMISPIANPEMWLAAAGQIFFSLSVGFGIVMTYASYLRNRDDVVLSGLSASSVNEFCEVCLGGLITVPAAFIFLGGDTITQFAGSSLKVGFFALPAVFERMPLGHFFGFLWFFMLFLAALTSSISMLQPVIAFLEEGFNLKRRDSVVLLGLITAIGSFFVIYFSKDLVALDTMDFWVGNFLIFVHGTIILLLFGWVVGMKKGMEEAHRGAKIKIPRFFYPIIKYISPVYLLAIFSLFIYSHILKNQGEPGSYAYKLFHDGDTQITITFLLILAVFLGLLINRASSRWDKIDSTIKEVV